MAGTSLLSASAAAQGSNTAQAHKTGSDSGAKKEVKFEVISIRALQPGSSQYGSHYDPNPTPTGFLSTLTVWQMLMIAYAPDDQSWANIPIVNTPKWFQEADFYVINARVSDADQDAWRKQSNRHELLRSAMQDLLRERCKLVLHELPTEIRDYKLVIGRNGLKMKATVPGSTPPAEGHLLPTGGVRFATGPRDRPTWHYYGATMGELVNFLSPPGTGSPAPPIHDATGLTGRYDFTLQMIDEPSRDRYEEVFNFPVVPLGLELKPGKFSGIKLVIDHMEKPTPNN
jgi:uncharacterized protein (TIGR03435 family)